MTDFRKEADGLGGAEVRADKLWGAQIQPLFKHFSFGKDLVPREIISAYVILKKGCGEREPRRKTAGRHFPFTDSAPRRRDPEPRTSGQKVVRSKRRRRSAGTDWPHWANW